MTIWKSALRRLTALCLCLALCLSLAGCGGDSAALKGAVPVQSVSMLMGLDLSGSNRYCGVAEPKSTDKVKKDANKDVDEIKVKVGQEVKKGDVLFTYDPGIGAAFRGERAAGGGAAGQLHQLLRHAD